MSLTSKLLASPRALTRIQLYCRGRLGYIVPGMLGPEEVTYTTPSPGSGLSEQSGMLTTYSARTPHSESCTAAMTFAQHRDRP